MSDARVIVFTGGGTGGHIYPGLAVIERLRESFEGRIVWLGSSKDSDRRTVEAAGVEYLAIPSGKLRRSFSLKNAADAFRVLGGYFASRRILKRLRPCLLFSKGGYVSVPPCRAAAALGIAVFTHESDLTPGLATRLNAKVAESLLVSYEETRDYLAKDLGPKVHVVGNPIRSAIRRGDAAKARRSLGLEAGLPLVLFVGGSQGARQVNDLVEAILTRLCAKAVVVHQTGPGCDEEAWLRRLQAAPLPEGRYRRFDYIREELPDILAAASVVSGRAGAATIWEAGALAKPMVLIPLAGSGTRGDQVDNARLFEKAGAATVLLGDQASPEGLLAAVEAYLDDATLAAKAGAAAARIAGKDAAALTAALILDRIGGKP